MSKAKKTKEVIGALRVWHIPQIPGKPFHVSVGTPAEAKKVLAILADYDLFQYQNRIKPDYFNAGGLEVLEADCAAGGPCWCEWYDDETGDCIDDWKPPNAAA